MSYAPGVATERSLENLCRPVVFQEPERLVHPPSWLEHTPFAFWIVDALRPSIFVELGCQSGNSYASFAQAVQYLGLTTACYAVDTWAGDPHAGFFDESVFEEWSAYHDPRFSTFSRLIRSTFDEALEHFSDGSIDLLHIDGFHEFEAASHDFETWRPKLSERGIVLWHDINVRENDFGVWRLWERLKDEYPSFEFRHGHGLGVLGVGNDLPEPMRWLFSLPTGEPESTNIVRLFFSHLGAAVLGRYNTADSRRVFQGELAARDERLTQTTSDLEGLRARLSDSERDLADARTEAARLNDARATSDALVATRTAEAERLVSEAANLRARISALSHDLGNRSERLARADDSVARLMRRLAESQRSLAATETRAAQLSRALTRAESMLAVRSAEVGRLASDVRSRDEELERLEHELDATVRARRASQSVAPKLDAEATALLERLQGERSERSRERSDETIRRRRVDSVLLWSRAQIAALATHASRERVRYLGRLKAGVSGLAAALRTAGGRPRAVVHVLRMAAVRGRLRDFSEIQASGLFDETYYLANNPEVSAAGIPALVHFVLEGGPDGRDPHPLFSTAFYATQVPGLEAGNRNPLLHYLQHGWRMGYSPHALFDPAFYLAQNTDAACLGVDPLRHYLEQGAAARRSPHPLFDVSFYLRENRDVLDSGIEPLTHFIRFGWREGRKPSAAFDVDDYLARHPQVRASGANPLVHCAWHNRVELFQDPVAPRTRSRGERLTGTTRVELSACSLASRDENPPTIVVVSHVGPWRPRAGNDYRVRRMLHWYRAQGYRIVPLIAPLPGEELPREGIEEIAAELGNIIQVRRDGTVEYILRDLPDVMASLAGTFTPSFADLLEEDVDASPRDRELLALERTFCHDAVISTVLHLERSLGPHILQVEYIWMTRLLPLVRGAVLKVVDTIDVLSSNQQKVGAFGVHDVVVDPREEAARLRRADLAIAIQDDERLALTRLVPGVRVITAGVDFDLVDDGPSSPKRRILNVGSNNSRNRKGLLDFLRLAWPRIQDSVPDAELLVVGSVSKALEGRDVAGVIVAGPVDDLTPLYRDAAAVINPAVAGTGLKIKTIEALCRLRPVVTWPAGVEGLDPKLAALCLVARDWYEFSERVIHALAGARGGGFSTEDRAAIAGLVASEHVYAAVDSAYSAFFGLHRSATARPGLRERVVTQARSVHART